MAVNMSNIFSSFQDYLDKEQELRDVSIGCKFIAFGKNAGMIEKLINSPRGMF